MRSYARDELRELIERSGFQVVDEHETADPSIVAYVGTADAAERHPIPATTDHRVRAYRDETDDPTEVR